MFIYAHGVYWLKMLIPKHYMKPDADSHAVNATVTTEAVPKQPGSAGGQDFGRPGKA